MASCFKVMGLTVIVAAVLMASGGGNAGTDSSASPVPVEFVNKLPFYASLGTSESSSIFIAQANAQGANGYFYKEDSCFDSTCFDKKSLFVKSTGINRNMISVGNSIH